VSGIERLNAKREDQKIEDERGIDRLKSERREVGSLLACETDE
jgi:hypothetical protein